MSGSFLDDLQAHPLLRQPRAKGMHQVMPSEGLNPGVSQSLRPPLLVIADCEHRTNRSRVIPTRPPTEVQLSQPLEGFNEIINHVNQTALAVLGVPQGDDTLIEIHIDPLEAVLLTLLHQRSQSYVEFAETMPHERFLILGKVSFRLNVTEQRSEPLLLIRLEPANHSVIYPPLLHISRRIDLHLIPELAVLVDRGEMCLEPIQCARLQRCLLRESPVTARTPPLDAGQPVLNLPRANTHTRSATQGLTDQVESVGRIALIFEPSHSVRKVELLRPSRFFDHQPNR